MKKSTLLIVTLGVFCGAIANEYKPVILIDPAGNARDRGRKLVESFERGVTFQFAEKLQKKLQQDYNVTAVLTRAPGEEVLPFQNASFANRLHADLFIRLQLYREHSIKPKIGIYHLVYDRTFDFASRIIDPFSFISVYQAHFSNIHKTKMFGEKMYARLNAQNYKKYFDCYMLRGIPLKHLVGIQASALTIECGISSDNQWEKLIDPLVESLQFIKDFNR